MEPRAVLAKGAAGQYFNDLVKACEDHFTRNYPQCVDSTAHGTVMCPSAFSFGYVAPTGQASGAKPLTKVEEDTIRGDTAELKIFHLLEQFGEETTQPMFVISQLKLSEFSKHVLQQRLPADHPVFSNNLKKEIDFMIIHKKIGVVLIEVKGNNEFRKGLQSEARKQLQNGEKIIKALLSPDDRQDIGIPIHKVIAMPNVCDPCPDSANYIGLRKINVCSGENFRSWWTSKFAEREFDVQEQSRLQSLISIFVGQRSEVSSTVLVNVYKKIDTQNFLTKSFKKETKSNGSREVLKTATDAEQAILAKQFLFLNPDQLRIWNGERHMFFNGSSGSGKTILLQFQALKCARAGEKVVAVVPMPLIARYKEFFSQNSIPWETVDVLSPVDFFNLNYLEELEDTGASPFHFFADELQTFESEVTELLFLLEKLMASFANSDRICWVAYDYMQNNEVEASVTGGLSEGAKLQTEARKLCAKYNFCHPPCLKTVVRSTFQIYNYVQTFVKKSLEDMLKLALTLEHIDEKTKLTWTQFVKRYDVSNNLGHHICGPSVSVFNNSDLENTARLIEIEINKWSSKNCLDRVAVLVTKEVLKERLSHLMTSKGFPVREVEMQANAVVIDYGYKAHSHEWPVVIAVLSDDGSSLIANYIMFTRAITRLVAITSRLI